MVRELVESFGGRLIGWYMTFGDYDFLAITEGPDQKAILGALAIVAAGGGSTDLKTTIAMTGADMKEAFAAAGKTGARFRPAGQAGS